MINKALNTGTLANKATQDITWSSSLFNWSDADAGWSVANSFANKSLNTGSMTNRPIS